MSVAWAMVLFGSLLIVAGWQDLSLAALARGDNTKPKGAVLAGRSQGSDSSAQPTTAPAATTAPTGAGGGTTGAGSPAPSTGGGGAW